VIRVADADFDYISFLQNFHEVLDVLDEWTQSHKFGCMQWICRLTSVISKYILTKLSDGIHQPLTSRVSWHLASIQPTSTELYPTGGAAALKLEFPSVESKILSQQ